MDMKPQRHVLLELIQPLKPEFQFNGRPKEFGVCTSLPSYRNGDITTAIARERKNATQVVLQISVECLYHTSTDATFQREPKVGR